MICHRSASSRIQAVSILILVMLISGIGLCGCSSNQPRMSGFALGNARIVKSGDIVTLRSPLTPDGNRQWRVVSYDSHHLVMIQKPLFVRNPDGTGEIVTKARAKAAGETKVELVEIRPQDGRSPRRMTFKVTITQ